MNTGPDLSTSGPAPSSTPHSASATGTGESAAFSPQFSSDLTRSHDATQSTDSVVEERSSSTSPPAGENRIGWRIGCALWALFAVPAAIGLLTFAMTRIMRTLIATPMEDGIFSTLLEQPGVPAAIGAFAAGLLLLATVGLSEMRSSSGLLVAGGYAVIALLTGLAPTLLFSVLLDTGLPVMPLWNLVAVPVATVLLPLMAGCESATFWARRGPRTSPAVGLLVPLLLAIGMLILLVAHSRGPVRTVERLEVIDPLSAALLAMGWVIVVIAAASTRWSQVALAIPGILLLVATAALHLPGMLTTTGRRIFTSPFQLWIGNRGSVMLIESLVSLQNLLIGGIGVAAGVLMLIHTTTMGSVRRQTRTRQRLELAEPDAPR